MTVKQQTLNAVVTNRIEVAPGLIVLRVAPEGWELPPFVPGQFAVLGLPPEAARCHHADPEEETLAPGKLIRRAYSIASSSVARQHLEFYVNLVHSGSFTPRLFALMPGDRLWLGRKITGTFTLDLAPPRADVVFIATGTGLAPYMSMLRSISPESQERRFAVLLGARHSWDLGYHAELEAMQRLWPAFSYLPIVSRPGDEVAPWTGRIGHVSDLWRDGLLEDVWGARPTPETARVFLCGSPRMIEDMIRFLGDEGFREHSRTQPGEIFAERYW